MLIPNPQFIPPPLTFVIGGSKFKTLHYPPHQPLLLFLLTYHWTEGEEGFLLKETLLTQRTSCSPWMW